MSTLESTTQAPKARRAFERAQARYKEQMNSDELQRLAEISNLDHLVVQAQMVSHELQRKTKSTSLEHKIGNLAASLAPFERILMGVCQLSPMGGELIWGSVSFILEMAKDNNNVLEEVLEFFIQMTDAINHLQEVESTFDGSTMVISAIEAVYVAIIEFWVKATDYYRMRNKKDLKSRVKIWLASSSTLTKEFANLKGKIMEQTTRLHQVEATQHHASERSYRTQLQSARQMTLQKELTKWIDACHYARDLSAAEEHRYEGTCEWLRDKQAYRDWMSNQKSGLLVIYGTAGVGKTILSSWLVNETRLHPGQHIILYHYFKETDDSKNTPLAAVRSLLDQLYGILLFTSHTLVATLENELQHLSRNIHVDFEPLWKILSLLLSQYSLLSNKPSTSVVTIILDAMDECQGSRTLVQSLRKLVHTTSNKIRVAVTARQSGDHVDEFRRKPSHQTIPLFLEITQDDVKDDITAFVVHTILQIERLDNPKHYDLRDHVMTRISDVRNHQGMFLWAYLMCKEVDCQHHVSGIQKLLDHLPKGLDGMYARICKRLSANDDRTLGFTRLVLQWIVASRRPMTFAELEEALSITTINDRSSGNGFFGKDGGLLWSRRDIVQSCGDLVRYTGLDEGDTIGVVHLSARQFLSTHPSKLVGRIAGEMSVFVDPFLVDAHSTELKMGMACIKYILSTSSHYDEYRSSPLPFTQDRTPQQDAFKQRYQFFSYATVYWMEYVSNTIRYEPCLDIDGVHQLLETISDFTHSSVSDVWLEEFIRLTYLEFAQNSLRRFNTLDATLVSADVLRWSNLVLRTLLDFSQSLSSSPNTVRHCISHLRSAATDSLNTISENGIPPLETDRYRHWIRYDPPTGNLFSVTGLSEHAMKCQALNTGVRLRPQRLSFDQRYEGVFWFRSAATSASANFIAIMYSHSAPHIGYLTMCWSTNVDRDGSPSTDDWATIVFTSYNSDERDVFSHSGVAFGKNNTIVTPNGIFSLDTKALIDRPSTIYDPDPTLCITKVFFSGKGERVARISNNILEILDIHGKLICQHDFGGASMSVKGFSDTGTKAVVCVPREENWLCCFLVNGAKTIDMSRPFGTFVNIEYGIFTPDEGRYIAAIDEGVIWNRRRLAVWTFLLDGDGSYHNHADMIYIFDGPNCAFDVVPGTLENALIVEESGIVTRQPLNLEWAPREKSASQMCWVLTKKNPPELIIWSINSSDVKIENWTVGSLRPELVSYVEEPIHTMTGTVFEPSPDGSYLATRTSVIDARTTTPNGLGLYAFDLPGRIVVSAFSVDGALFTCLCYADERSTLHVFDISRGPQLTQRASYTFDEELDSSTIVFGDHDPTLLTVGGYVMRLQGRRLIVQTRFDKAIFSFSGCGLYYCDNGYEVHQLQDILDPEKSFPTEMRHPRSMKLNTIYIYSPHILELWTSKGIVYFSHRLVPQNEDASRCRIIYVLPDAIPNDDATLQWPEEDDENLTFVIVWKGAPRLIDTGVKKGELMKEDEWFKFE